MANKKGDYEIGYGKPPRHTRFQKGQSGNPNGRKRSTQSAYELMERTLSKLVEVTINGRRSKISKRSAIYERFVNMALAADVRAIKLFFDYEHKLRPAQQPQGAQEPVKFSLELFAQLRRHYDETMEQEALLAKKALTPEELREFHRLWAKIFREEYSGEGVPVNFAKEPNTKPLLPIRPMKGGARSI
jgi:hypothetical protein